MGAGGTVRAAPEQSGRDDAEEPAMRTISKIFASVVLAALFVGGVATAAGASVGRPAADTPWGGGSVLVTPDDTPWGGG
jgi:hypothetical protein